MAAIILGVRRPDKLDNGCAFGRILDRGLHFHYNSGSVHKQKSPHTIHIGWYIVYIRALYIRSPFAPRIMRNFIFPVNKCVRIVERACTSVFCVVYSGDLLREWVLMFYFFRFIYSCVFMKPLKLVFN